MDRGDVIGNSPLIWCCCLLNGDSKLTGPFCKGIPEGTVGIDVVSFGSCTIVGLPVEPLVEGWLLCREQTTNTPKMYKIFKVTGELDCVVW